MSRQFKKIIEKTADTIVVVDREGRILFANPTAQSLFEKATAELIGTSFGVPVSKDKIYEMDIPNSSGNNFVVEVHPSDIEWDNRPCYLLIIRDITERKKLEEELFQTRKMEAIGVLAGGIAHDFNNILTAILGFAHLASMELDNPHRLKEDLGEITRAGKRAKELVEQLLSFSRQKEFRLYPIRMDLMVKEVVKLIRPVIPANIDIKTDLRTRASVLANPSKIHQVLINLSTNAAYAMKDKPGHLKITLTETDRQMSDSEDSLEPGATQQLIEICVTDTGTGIPPDLLRDIFNPYFTTKPVGEGSGIGLSVVQGIVKELEGDIQVQSTLGLGSCFRVRLPITDKVDERTGQRHRSSAQQIRNEHILVVDDEVSITKIMKRVLEKAGYSVVVSNDPTAALADFNAHPDHYDLVITDLSMPHMTGVQLMKKIHEKNTGVPVILCSGYREKSIMSEECTSQKKCYFIEKPIDNQGLLDAIRRVLDQF